MQDKEVRAFRQRLVRGGFTDISIFNCYNGNYIVECISPKGDSIQVEIDKIKMDNIPYLVYFDDIK